MLDSLARKSDEKKQSVGGGAGDRKPEKDKQTCIKTTLLKSTKEGKDSLAEQPQPEKHERPTRSETRRTRGTSGAKKKSHGAVGKRRRRETDGVHHRSQHFNGQG